MRKLRGGGLGEGDGLGGTPRGPREPWRGQLANSMVSCKPECQIARKGRGRPRVPPESTQCASRGPPGWQEARGGGPGRAPIQNSSQKRELSKSILGHHYEVFW